jgi:hypothetical protein
MRKMMFVLLTFGFLLACNKEETNVVDEDGTNLKINNPSKKFVGDQFNASNLQGETFKLDNGIVYFFNQNKNKFSNALALIPKTKGDIAYMDKFLSKGDISLNYEKEYVYFRNKEDEQFYFIVENEKGHAKIHDVEDAKTNKIKLIRGIQIANWYGDDRFNIENILKNVNLSKTKVNDLLTNQNVDTRSGRCSSGGVGSTGCSIDDPISGCSVTCASGYYACCSSGSNICTCKENPAHQD